jgi:hypothetical protein
MEAVVAAFSRAREAAAAAVADLRAGEREAGVRGIGGSGIV